MSLRTEQRALTRSKILGAVIDLVADGSLDELSVPAVSRRSGVSLATIYRHFPTKDDLVTAAAEEPARRATDPEAAAVEGDDQLGAFQRTMWTDFADHLPLLRHQVSSAAGREMRRARLERSRAGLADYLAAEGIELDLPEGERLTALVLLLVGSLGFLELHDRQGLSVDESIAVSTWAARALIEATRQEQREGARR